MLVVVGGASGRDGRREVERIGKLAASLGVADRIRFADPQPHHMLSTYYRAADVVLVPSRSESFGLVALEAAACGTPVVAAAVGGLRTLVEHGRTGFLVEGRDPEVFAAYTERDPRQPGPGPGAGGRRRQSRPQLHVVDRRRPPAADLRGPHRPLTDGLRRRHIGGVASPR